MNHENEVKVRWTIPGRHAQLTILPYNKYSWPIAYALRKKTKTQKHWAMNPVNEIKVKWNMQDWHVHHIIFCTLNIVDLLHIVLEKRPKTQKPNFDHWMKHENEVKVRWHLPARHVIPNNHSIHQI